MIFCSILPFPFFLLPFTLFYPLPSFTLYPLFPSFFYLLPSFTFFYLCLPPFTLYPLLPFFLLPFTLFYPLSFTLYRFYFSCILNIFLNCIKSFKAIGNSFPSIMLCASASYDSLNPFSITDVLNDLLPLSETIFVSL